VTVHQLIDRSHESAKLHDRIHRQIFGLSVRSSDLEVQVPSLLNMNRELFVAQGNLIHAMGETHLPSEELEQLWQRPVVN